MIDKPIRLFFGVGGAVPENDRLCFRHAKEGKRINREGKNVRTRLADNGLRSRDARVGVDIAETGRGNSLTAQLKRKKKKKNRKTEREKNKKYFLLSLCFCTLFMLVYSH